MSLAYFWWLCQEDCVKNRAFIHYSFSASPLFILIFHKLWRRICVVLLDAVFNKLCLNILLYSNSLLMIIVSKILIGTNHLEKKTWKSIHLHHRSIFQHFVILLLIWWCIKGWFFIYLLCFSIFILIDSHDVKPTPRLTPSLRRSASKAV